MARRSTLRRRVSAPAGAHPETETPRLIVEDAPAAGESPLDSPLRALVTVTACYPRVIAAFIQALVTEGKRFAETPEGAQLQRELGAASWVEKGRILWETCGLDELLNDAELSGEPDQSIADAIRTLRRSLAHTDLEPLLSRLMFRGISFSYDDLSRTGSRIRNSQ